MPRPKVFVSYSHKDKKALEQLWRFLHTLEREGLLATWADTALQGGDDWKREIDQALAEATVAVLLISQDFLASDFIVQEELPRILEREATGLLTVLPVFLSPSQVDHLGFSDPRSGGRGKVHLSKFQGFGSSDKPLSGLTWADRDRIYLQLSERLQALAGLVAAAPPLVLVPVGPPITPSPGPARAYELTVQLEDRGETLLVTYHLPGRSPSARRPASWEELRRRIAPIHEALDRGHQPQALCRSSALRTVGEKRCSTCFSGRWKGWESIFRTLFSRPGGPRPNPTLWSRCGCGSIRRIHDFPACLGGLPPGRASRSSMRGGSSRQRETSIWLGKISSPPRRAMCSSSLRNSPGSGGGPHEPEHARAVLDVLKKAWPTGREAGYVRSRAPGPSLSRACGSIVPTSSISMGMVPWPAAGPACCWKDRSGPSRWPWRISGGSSRPRGTSRR